MLKKKSGSTFRHDLRDLLIEILEACVHHILASRSIYPRSIFTQRLFGPVKGGVPIMASEHPDINSFIVEGLSGFKEAIINPSLSSTIDQFDLVIIQNADNGQEPVVETYAFQFAFYQAQSDTDSDMYLKEKDRIAAEQNIRALMLSLTSRMAELGPLKSKMEKTNEADYFFNFRIHTSEQTAQRISEDLRWCKAPAIPRNCSGTIQSCSSTIPDTGDQSAFSICDMVLQRSQQQIECEKTGMVEKGEKPKSDRTDLTEKENEKQQFTLMEETEPNQTFYSEEEGTNGSEVIVPVYQFDIPFKFKLLIEHFEDD